MDYERIHNFVDQLNSAGGPFHYSPEQSRLLIRTWRLLAKGNPISGDQADGLIADVGIDRDEAQEFLRTMTERDHDDNIVGVMGLSLKNTPHKFRVGGIQLFTWCAEDTLFLPAMLGQTAMIESSSPITRQKVRLTVAPDSVKTFVPEDAVVSIVVPSQDNFETESVEKIWGSFCHHIFFFASRNEGEQWAANRDDIEFVSPEQAYELGKQIWGPVLSHA